ncbi:MAG: hypothetical protein IPO83_14095 [Chitinophagaceae bacterium]|nr:hypothetical protein [Chitinophagaceae bacterium]
MFADIENDLTTNFPGFMQKSGLGNITPCQSFTLSFAHMSAKEDLNIASATIAINRKGQSKKEESRQANPTPLVQLMQKKISDYKQLTEDPLMTSGSNIANVLLKAIIQSNPDAENYFFLFSDMYENNLQLNLYKGVPDKKDVPKIISRMIEPSVLDKFHKLQKEGLQEKIIIVMKQEPSGRKNQRAVKDFWIAVFSELKLQTQFVDNLTNTIDL